MTKVKNKELDQVIEKIKKQTKDPDAIMRLGDGKKKMKDIDEVNIKQNTTNVTNNSLFVGSTSELQKMLKKMNKENDK